MRLPLHTVKAGIATAMSLWIAVLACLMGCTLPSLAGSFSAHAAAMQPNLPNQDQPELMAGMEDCPHHHHSDGDGPAKPNDGIPVRGGGMSCCPVEATLAAKPDIAKLGITRAHDFMLRSNFNWVTIRFYQFAEFVPRVWHSGRNTLLETHLLRI
jgi:hypothetical protein